MTSLRQKTLSALFWNLTGTVGYQFLQFITSLVLARLLAPEEFGVMALLVVFMNLASTLIDSGFGAALIQRQDVTRRDESTIFYFNLMVAVLLFGGFWLLAPLLANFYQQPLLIPLTRILSLVVICNAGGVVQGCLLTKQLNFRLQTRALICATALSGALAIFMALQDRGIWSLVALALGNAAGRTLFLWLFSSWRPLWCFDWGAVTSMFPYGSRLLISQILGVLFREIYPLVIGKLFSQAQVGFYSRAQHTQRYATDALTGVITTVSFPAYSTIQNDRELLRANYRSSIIYASVLLFPLMLGLSALAKPLFLLLYTEKWATSIPYFQILCLSGALYHLHALNLNILKATGRSELLLRLAVIKILVAALGILIGSRFGMLGIVWAQVVVSWLCLNVNTYYTDKLIAYPLRAQVWDVAPIFGVSAASAAAVLAVGGWVTGWSLVAQLSLGVALHLALYLGLAWLLGIHAVFELIHLLKTQVHQRLNSQPNSTEDI